MPTNIICGLFLPAAYVGFILLQRKRAYLKADTPTGPRGGVWLGAMIAGTAAVGGGAVLAPIMAPILIGAGIPDALALVVLATTQAVIAPLASVLTVQATCNLAVLTARQRPSIERLVFAGGHLNS